MREPIRRRGPVSPFLHLTVRTSSAVPLYRQIYDGLRDAILGGRLAGNARVPSTRVLAADLGVSRNTVLQAYEQLRSEGYLSGRRGGGTRTRAVLPEALLQVERARAARRAPTARSDAASRRAASSAPVVVTVPRLSARGARLVAVEGLYARRTGRPVPFELGVPADDAFPSRLWGQLAGRRWRRGDLGRDGDPAGEAALRHAIADYAATARGVACSAGQVLVVNGAQQALHLIAHALLDPGDDVWFEEPGYGGARAAFAASGARLVPVPIDQEGLAVELGRSRAPHARLAYVTPSHQFPLGVVMSAARRLRLLAWAHAAGAWIVEDDYDSEFRYTGRPLACLQGLEADQAEPSQVARVLYVGTFSKTLLSGLRIGYLIVPDALVDPLRAVRSAMDRHTSTAPQYVLADFIAEGHYARHIRHVRSLCAERQATLVAASSEKLAGLLDLAPDPAGLHLLGRLSHGISGRAAQAAASAVGMRTWALSSFYAEHSAPDDALVLGYAAFTTREIHRGVDELARILSRLSLERSRTGSPSTPIDHRAKGARGTRTTRASR